MEIGNNTARYPQRINKIIKLPEADSPSRRPFTTCVNGSNSNAMRKKDGNMSSGKNVPHKNDIGVMTKLDTFAISACESMRSPTINPIVENT